MVNSNGNMNTYRNSLYDCSVVTHVFVFLNTSEELKGKALRIVKELNTLS